MTSWMVITSRMYQWAIRSEAPLQTGERQETVRVGMSLELLDLSNIQSGPCESSVEYEEEMAEMSSWRATWESEWCALSIWTCLQVSYTWYTIPFRRWTCGRIITTRSTSTSHFLQENFTHYFLNSFGVIHSSSWTHTHKLIQSTPLTKPSLECCWFNL